MHTTDPSAHEAGFTLLELIVALALTVVLVVSFIPALATTRPDAKTTQCRSNLRRLTMGWSMYCTDFSDRVPNNFGVSETLDSINNQSFATWVNNVMTWAASPGVGDISNTNVLWLKDGVLGRYLAGSVGLYKCPSDNYLSPMQRAAGWPGRVRSYSMNAVFGRFSSTPDPTASGQNWGFPQYLQYLKSAQVPKPAKTWLLIEEHPDSINDGYFINSPQATSWQDIPSSLHNSACTFSFVDGHAESKRWQSATSCYPVQFYYPATRAFDLFGRNDYAWYLARTGWVDARTRQAAFGY